MSQLDFTLTGKRLAIHLTHLHLSYLEWHPGGIPLLLLHGLADHGLVWANFAQSLDDGYHCIAPDIRGHGETDKPDRGYRCVDVIADLEALFDRLSWSSAHVIAHSWSAKVAAVWATRSPERFRSLVLVDPFFINKMPGVAKFSFPILYRTLSFLKMMGPFPSYEAAQERARTLPQFEAWTPFQQAVLHQNLEQKPDGSWGSKFGVQVRNQTFEDVMTIAGLTQPLAIPCLFIQPEQGLNRKAWQLKPYRKYLNNLEIKTISGNHWPFLGSPATFNPVVAQFLEQVTRSSA